MNDRTGQVWHVGSDEMWQVFVVLGISIERGGAYEHQRLILSSNWEAWPGKVAPYPEDLSVPWEGLDYFRRIA